MLTVGVAPAIIPNVPAPQVRLQRWHGPAQPESLAEPALGPGIGAAGRRRLPRRRVLLQDVHVAILAHLRTAGPLRWRGSARRQRPATCRQRASNTSVATCSSPAQGLPVSPQRWRPRGPGARVVVVEREPMAGGELEYELATIDAAAPASDWVTSCCDELRSLVRAPASRTRHWSVAPSGLYVANHEPGGIAGANTVYKIRPRALVVGVGCGRTTDRVRRQRSAGRHAARRRRAVQRTLRRAAWARRAVLFANHDRVYAAALRLRDAGVRSARPSSTLASRLPRSDQAMADRRRLQTMGVECLAGHAVLATLGRGAVRGASVAPLAAPASRRID